VASLVVAKVLNVKVRTVRLRLRLRLRLRQLDLRAVCPTCPLSACASFQHDESAIGAVTAVGYNNVMWGSVYPHMEGTYGHTQETLHHLFDGVQPAVVHRVTIGAFLDLFPGVGEPPG
jgi:hypothetical protein